MKVSPGQFAALKNLCIILNVPLASCQPNPALALRLLTLTYALPMIRQRDKVRTAGNEILGATQPDFDKWSQFVLSIGRSIAMMQTVPAFFNTLRLSTSELATAYKRAETVNWILETAGMVGGAGAATSGAAEAIKSGSVRQGLKAGAGEFLGRGPITQALEQRFGPKAPARAGALTMFAAVVARLVYESNKMQMAEVRARMQHEFQSGRAKPEEYRKVFGEGVDPASIRKYWNYP